MSERAVRERAPAAKAARAAASVAGEPSGLRRALLRWFDRNRRDLPWRRDRDPYRVWISEVMLQQTRIEVVVPAYERFVAAFPDHAALARAPEDRVLSLWSGLGYYSRARSLRRAAVALVERGDGGFPRDLDAALALPGVGRYTAAAVLSIAYGAPLAAVDGNAIRVLSRLAKLPLPDGRGEPHRGLAESLLDRTRPGDWNQAMMELGQTVCRPLAPLCGACPLAGGCRAHRDGVVERYPPRKPRRATERHAVDLVVLRDRADRVLLERGAFAHLRHLWLPPIVPDDRKAPARNARAWPRLRPAGRFRHAILHRSFEVRVEQGVVADDVLDLAARGPLLRGSERRVFTRGELGAIGRSSLLTKSLALAGLKLREPGAPPARSRRR